MQTYFVAFWNLENLFDIEKSPRRTEKLDRVLGKELKGWNQSVLDRKIAQLASIVTGMNDGASPDILGVCEVENRFVLELLRNALHAPGRDYQVAHADTLDNRGIDVAFLYDGNKFSAESVFFHFIVRRVATRDLVQLNLISSTTGRRLVLVGCHWPSRSGGQLQSEPYRMLAGETLAYFHERIREVHGPDTPVIAMGDFNDEPFDRSLVQYALSERQRAKVTLARTARFWNLMWPFVGTGTGSFYFSNHANVIDQFLCSRPLITGASGFTVDPASATIYCTPDMARTGVYPGPIAFGRGSSINKQGFSDHFPITITIRESS